MHVRRNNSFRANLRLFDDIPKKLEIQSLLTIYNQATLHTNHNN